MTAPVQPPQWLRGYDRRWLRADLLAALTLWALVVPQAIAYGGIAQMPPEAGLYTAAAGLLAYGLLGTCRQLVVSPTSSTAAISAALVAPLAGGDAARYATMISLLAIMVGFALILLGVLRMGFVSRFIAAGTQVGFMFGLGLTIIVGQLPDLLGVPHSDGDVFAQLEGVLSHLDEVSGWTIAIGLGGLIALVGTRRISPAAPGALLVVVGGILLVALLGLTDDVAVLGEIEAGRLTLALPDVGRGDIAALLPGALAIAIIGYAESATVAEELAENHGYEVEPDRELRAIGSANILAGLMQGFITGGGASQSAANDSAGGKTQLVSLLVAGLAVLTAVALLPVFRDLPQAVLAAIVINAVVGFLNVHAMARLLRLQRDSFVLALVTMTAVLVLGMLAGLPLAVAISIVTLLARASRPSLTRLGVLGADGAPRAARYVPLEDAGTPSDGGPREDPGVLAYRLDAPLLFLNAKHLRTMLRRQLEAARDREDARVRVVLLDLGSTNRLDVDALDVLLSLRDELAEQDIALWLANVRTTVRAALERSRQFEGTEDQQDGLRIYPSMTEARTDWLRLRSARAPGAAVAAPGGDTGNVVTSGDPPAQRGAGGAPR